MSYNCAVCSWDARPGFEDEGVQMVSQLLARLDEGGFSSADGIEASVIRWTAPLRSACPNAQQMPSPTNAKAV